VGVAHRSPRRLLRREARAAQCKQY
jgi:hypothetical protein